MCISSLMFAFFRRGKAKISGGGVCVGTLIFFFLGVQILLNWSIRGGGEEVH
jgi:hypothetical protein